ncbi:metallo cofactor biosynthesis protein, conjectural [Sulfobacillus acidophilus TPY]|nr:metallo cofactor biosynthesis protein, conjectural [Sulfobacillus acidophilus TPY]
MSRAVFEKLLEGIPELPNLNVVVFTGGEATLRKPLLLEGISRVHQMGKRTRLVTNGWWAKNPQKARAFVKELRESGLDEINTSFDDFHAPYTTIEHIGNLILAAMDHGLTIGVGVIVGSNVHYDVVRVKQELAEYCHLSLEDLTTHVAFLEDYATPTGRGELLSIDDIPELDKTYLSCPEIVKTLSVHPNGDVKVCCGHAMFTARDLTAGNLLNHSLPTIVERAQHNIFYWWLHMHGPRKILHDIGVNNHYTSICHACNDLLVNHLDEAVDYLKTHQEYIWVNQVLLSDAFKRQLTVIQKSRPDLLSS